jgi:glucose-6-phosphate 3-dehydrogenase
MKIGVIGCGSAAAAHIKALQLIPEVTEIYLVGRDFSRAQSFSKQFSKVECIQSIAELSNVVDAAIIATPNNTHLDVLKNIIENKKIPVLCEKPLASSLQEAQDFVGLAHPFSAIGFNYRFNPIISTISALIKERQRGDVIFIDITFNKNSAFTRRELSWRDHTDQKNSSGVLGDLGSHFFDLVSYFSNAMINKNSLKISKGTRVKERAGTHLTGEDYAIAVGSTANQVGFKVKVSKSSLESDLGFYLNFIFKRGEKKIFELRFAYHYLV